MNRQGAAKPIWLVLDRVRASGESPAGGLTIPRPENLTMLVCAREVTAGADFRITARLKTRDSDSEDWRYIGDPFDSADGPLGRIQIQGDQIGANVVCEYSVSDGAVADLGVLLELEAKYGTGAGTALTGETDLAMAVQTPDQGDITGKVVIVRDLYAGEVQHDDVDVAGSGIDLDDAQGAVVEVMSYYADASETGGQVSGVLQHSDDNGDTDAWSDVSGPDPLAPDDPVPAYQHQSIAKAGLKRWVRALYQGHGDSGSRKVLTQIAFIGND